MDQSTRSPCEPGDTVPALRSVGLGWPCLQDGLLAEQIPRFQKVSYAYLKAIVT